MRGKMLAVLSEPCKRADKLDCRFCNLPIFLNLACAEQMSAGFELFKVPFTLTGVVR